LPAPKLYYEPGSTEDFEMTSPNQSRPRDNSIVTRDLSMQPKIPMLLQLSKEIWQFLAFILSSSCQLWVKQYEFYMKKWPKVGILTLIVMKHENIDKS